MQLTPLYISHTGTHDSNKDKVSAIVRLITKSKNLISTFGFSLGQAAPASAATLCAFSASIVPRTDRLLLTAVARMWKDVPWRIFWHLKTLAVAL